MPSARTRPCFIHACSPFFHTLSLVQLTVQHDSNTRNNSAPLRCSVPCNAMVILQQQGFNTARRPVFYILGLCILEARGMFHESSHVFHRSFHHSHGIVRHFYGSGWNLPRGSVGSFRGTVEAYMVASMEVLGCFHGSFPGSFHRFHGSCALLPWKLPPWKLPPK